MTDSASSSVVTLDDEKQISPDTLEGDKASKKVIQEKALTQENQQVSPSVPKICPNCGKEVAHPEIKLIPSQIAWCTFACLFFCLLWWVSWIPFLINRAVCKCKKGVQMCPHCYRRLDRPPV